MDRRAILITGCSSGIGLATARYLRNRGFWVLTTARTTDDLSILRQEGFDAFYLELNDPSSIKNLVQVVMPHVSNKLYGLFNNAGFGQPGAVEDLKRPILEAQFATNVFGTIELTNLVIPYMRQQGQGRIIQNTSVLGYTPLPFRGAYNASKYALEGISDTLRLELLDNGSSIYVSVVAPGPITSRFRATALKKFQRNIDAVHSSHHATYERVLARLETEDDKDPFTLPPEAVAKKVHHALTCKRPPARYYVTLPAYGLAAAKRLLGTRLFLKFVHWISRQER